MGGVRSGKKEMSSAEGGLASRGNGRRAGELLFSTAAVLWSAHTIVWDRRIGKAYTTILGGKHG